MKRSIILAGLLWFAQSVDGAEPKIVGYFTEWSVYDRNYQVRDIPGDKLTHLNYAFAKIVDGECVPFDSYAALEKPDPDDKTIQGNFNQLRQLKKRHPHLQTLISIGGWTLSGPFSDLASSVQTRTKFAKSCIAFIKKYGFDGVDIDWEYPVEGGQKGNKTRPEDKANYALLLAELRSQLNAQEQKDKKHYLLTIAAPAGPRLIGNLDLAAMNPSVDWINLMAYDFHGSWDATTHFNAPLFPIRDDPAADAMSRKLNVDAAVKAYIAAGMPAQKIVLGVPFYGRGWAGVKNDNNGLFQPKQSIPKGTWEEGVFDYKDLSANYIGKFKRHWHDEAKVPWLFDAQKGLMTSYDDPESLKLKANYVREKKLGGMMCWELSADDAKRSLLGAIHDALVTK